MRATHETCNFLFDSLPLLVKRQLANIIEGYNKAIEKHPKWPDDLIHSAAIVSEESGELTKAALEHKYEKGSIYELHKEAVQTGAVALRFLVEMPNVSFGPDPGIFDAVETAQNVEAEIERIPESKL